jgi:hypothetical protein
VRSIDADLNCSPQNEYVSKKTVAKIDSILDKGEKVHYLAKARGSGVIVEGSGTSYQKKGKGGWVRTAATDKRVAIKIPQHLGNDERAIPYRNITSVDLDLGWVFKRLTLQTAGETYHIGIGAVSKDECRKMTKFIRSKISEAQGSSEKSSLDPTEKLEKVNNLKEKGVLSQEEYENKKEELLDEI